MFARNVCGNGKQKGRVNELTRRVLKKWETIGSDLLNNLINSMRDRCVGFYRTDVEKQSIKPSDTTPS